MASGDGISYGKRLVELLHDSAAEVHLVMTPPSEQALGADLEPVRSLASQVYAVSNQAARISSGSFLTRGMIVAPCDGAGLGAIALGLATNLVFRAADVTLKERRPLVLGLVPSRSTSIEEDHLARAAEVPGLTVVRLEGAEDDAVAELLDQL
jgi:4-hydroxy-3-polyprenylbenzoate decarboxylase